MVESLKFPHLKEIGAEECNGDIKILDRKWKYSHFAPVQ